ncbi:hypothetical protein MNB_SV-13-1077 [hydrothermal vent metagenome]|uniref:Uncharacterized protein n=1 Tax=hydrothermal vent metagenome TaxID=652676 RepID=A0A1W1BKP0_9ZZZZ
MKLIISKYFTVGSVLLFILTSSVYAEAPKVAEAKAKTAKTDKIEIVPEIKIEAQDASKKNSKLKQGKACNFDDLEEAKGEEFTEIPMAQTIPCADVDCKNLKPAVLHKDNYKKLPDAKTIKGCD